MISDTTVISAIQRHSHCFSINTGQPCERKRVEGLRLLRSLNHTFDSSRTGGWGAERGMAFPTLHSFRFSLLECYLACHLDPGKFSINQMVKEIHGSTFFLRRHSVGGPACRSPVTLVSRFSRPESQYDHHLHCPTNQMVRMTHRSTFSCTDIQLSVALRKYLNVSCVIVLHVGRLSSGVTAYLPTP